MDRLFGALTLYPQHERSSRGCKRGKLLRRLVKDEAGRFAATAPTPEDEARATLVEASKAYCIARCGGCDLTRPRA